MTGDSSGCPELGSIVFFEHVNLRVPDHRLATLFFVEGLGLTRDPFRMVGTRNMWVNVGEQQFHLPLGEPSPLPGEVGVLVPDLDDVERRLRALEPSLAGTAFAVQPAGETLRVATPWGHAMRLHARRDALVRAAHALDSVTFRVAPGTAAGIGAFYRDVLECPVDDGAGTGAPGVRVAVGPFQHFRFEEHPEAPAGPGANHVAVYVTRYRHLYARLAELGSVFEPDRREQFRFRDIVDPVTRRALFAFEHEVRSLHHPDYRRPLVNRVPVAYPVD